MPAKSSEKEEMLNALVRRMYLVSCFIYLLTLEMGTEQTYICGYVGRYHIRCCYWSAPWGHEGKIHLQDMSYEVQNSWLRFHHLIRAGPLFLCLDAVQVRSYSYQSNGNIDATNSSYVTVQFYWRSRKLTNIRRRVEFASRYTFLRDGYYNATQTKKHRANVYAFIMIGAGGGNGSKDGTILLDCVNCQRQVRSVFASMDWINVVQVASNRYAPHLASCMGLSSARRAPSARTSGSMSGKPKCVEPLCGWFAEKVYLLW